MTRPLNIAFFHPDLGIGGAERLVVDAAISLQNRGHKVVIYTMHHDLSHCFEETRDGTLDVRTGGGRLVPRSIHGRFYILCTILRSLFLARQLTNDSIRYDALFVDQLSAPIPLLKFASAYIFFYCHFPDLRLARRDTLWRQLYRLPFDWLEEFTTGEADQIVVNSRYTQEIFRQTFPHISEAPKVLTPALNFQSYDKPVDSDDPLLVPLYTEKQMMLSINRFERKKNIELAVDSFARLLKSQEGHCLVVAGGWDWQMEENIEYLKELDRHAAEDLGLKTRTLAPRAATKDIIQNMLPEGAIRAPTFVDEEEAPISDQLANIDVLFLPSFSENQRSYLLSRARCVVYTPTNEHLGIVPLEAMYMRVPVVAVNSGGPRETIQAGKTGYLCDPTEEDFAAAITKLANMDDARWKSMGAAGHEHVNGQYGLDIFGTNLEQLIIAMAERPLQPSMVLAVLMCMFILFAVALTLLLTW